MSYTINSTFEVLIQTLNNNISIRENLLASVKDVTLSVDANGIPTSPAAFAVSNSNPIDGTQVIRAVCIANTIAYPTSGIFISYTQNGSTVTIANITGLPAGVQFNIRVLAYLT